MGASRGRLGPVLGASSAVLGASSSILCSSWGVLWILCGKAFENHRFYVRISNPEPLKIKPPLQREHDLRDFEIFENNLPFGSILVPTWLHFGSIFRVLGRLGASWGHLGASWKRLGPSSGPLGRILAHLGASWGVLEPSWHRFGPQKNPGLTMEREARDYSDAFALSGYLLRFSALAICKNSEN